MQTKLPWLNPQIQDLDPYLDEEYETGLPSQGMEI